MIVAEVADKNKLKNQLSGVPVPVHLNLDDEAVYKATEHISIIRVLLY